MKKPRHSSYPMAIKEREELATELSEFGFRETDDPDEADRRNYYKVERWDSTGQHVFQLLHASTISAGPKQSLRARRIADHAAATPCAKGSGYCSGGRLRALSTPRCGRQPTRLLGRPAYLLPMPSVMRELRRRVSAEQSLPTFDPCLAPRPRAARGPGLDS
jgi:hypothetical protein